MELEELEQLEPEELGWILLKNLKDNPPLEVRGRNKIPVRTLHFRNAAAGLDPTLDPNDANSNTVRKEHARLLMEGWQWLEHEGLISVDPTQSNSEFKVLTRRGQQLSTEEELINFSSDKLIPRTLHADILLIARSNFIRKDYETAVLHAFRSVEIAVRAGGGFENSDVGVTLMRAAFRPEATAGKPIGSLTNDAAEPGEKQGMMELFSGAIACFRNPSAHRQVNIERDEALELLCLASRLLKIVEQESTTPREET